MAAVDKYSQLHAARPAVVEEGVESGANGAAGVKHIIHQHYFFIRDIKIDQRRHLTPSLRGRL